MTTRLNTGERAVFAAIASAFTLKGKYPDKGVREPALGTLAQRLDIIVRRLPGEKRGLGPMTDDDRLALARARES